MRRFTFVLTACLLLGAVLAGCDVPKPPPELPTATPGSQNPENEASRLILTPVRSVPERGFTPLAGPPGHIYFARSSGLWRVSPDGSGEIQLSTLPVNSTPQPAPDGRTVAWVSGQDLYVIPSAGGSPTKLMSGDLAERQRLGWSPDGSLLGYIAYDKTTVGSEKAWAIPAAGGKPTPITTMNASALGRGPVFERSVGWSPDANWVLVSEVNTPMRLLRWPLTNRPEDRLDIPGGEPDWSPDSRTLLYSETLTGALVLYDVIEAGPTPFRNDKHYLGTGLSEYAEGPGPRWSPASLGSDGDLMAYRSHTPQGEPQVGIRERDGHELPSLPAFTNNPSWAPSGDRLVVETGNLTGDPLGPKWVPTGLSIATLELSEDTFTMTTLVKNGQWAAWGR